MKVYVAEENVDCAGASVLGVAGGLRKAKRIAEERMEGRWSSLNYASVSLFDGADLIACWTKDSEEAGWRQTLSPDEVKARSGASPGSGEGGAR